ncbi:hypothetical protein GCM10023205_04100 [Yinghuangia aomiensis]|uniref:Uncharacterized protein n=1 Tax=Yinghuangia aomiensis TaxID=676205 RepID=A0ABP9GMQ3_9ACTN
MYDNRAYCLEHPITPPVRSRQPGKDDAGDMVGGAGSVTYDLVHGNRLLMDKASRTESIGAVSLRRPAGRLGWTEYALSEPVDTLRGQLNRLCDGCGKRGIDDAA